MWLDTNIKSYSFISEKYRRDNFETVKAVKPQAEGCVFEDETSKEILGSAEAYIEGLFVKQSEESKGIGKQLLDYDKSIKSELSLCVYKKNTRATGFYKREWFELQSEKIR